MGGSAHAIKAMVFFSAGAVLEGVTFTPHKNNKHEG
jgi:hypothetical protein